MGLRVAGAVLAGGIVFGGAAGGAVLPSERDSWIEVRTPHFTLYSDASESKTRDIGLDLERFRSVLLLLRNSFSANAPVPTFVFVLKSESAMRPYLPVMAGRPRQSDGYFQATSDGNYIVLCAAWNTDPRPVVYHEYLHYFLHNNFPPQPLWYDEGLAGFYETFYANNKEAEIGRVRLEHLLFLRQNTLMPLERLFRIGHDSSEYSEESQAGLFYAESWALVHFLLRGEPNRTAELGRFLLLLQQGTPEETAFREAFGTDFPTLFSQLVSYVHGSRFSYNRLKFEDLKVSSGAEVRKLDYPETLLRLGDLLAHESEGQFDSAEAHLQAALARHPSQSGALATLGWIRMRQQVYAEAAFLLEKSIATGSADYRAYFYYGDLLMRLLANEVISVGRPNSRQRQIIDEARRALQRSVELSGDFAEARARLGKTYLVEEDSCLWEGIGQLEVAVQKLPSRRDVALDLARLYERKGERAKSEQLIQSAFGRE
jgi:tetratricopeptide (TPR) repeat protein